MRRFVAALRHVGHFEETLKYARAAVLFEQALRRRLVLRNADNDLFVELDDFLGKGIRYDFEEVLLASSRQVETAYDCLGHVVKIAAGDFERKKNENGEKIEHVVNRCPGESATKFVSVFHVTERDDRVGDRRSNVGAHHHGNGYLNANN